MGKPDFNNISSMTTNNGKTVWLNKDEVEAYLEKKNMSYTPEEHEAVINFMKGYEKGKEAYLSQKQGVSEEIIRNIVINSDLYGNANKDDVSAEELVKELSQTIAVDKEVLDKDRIQRIIIAWGIGLTIDADLAGRLADRITERFKPPKADNAELIELIDGAYNIVQIFKPKGQAQTKWQKEWLHKAYKILNSEVFEAKPARVDWDKFPLSKIQRSCNVGLNKALEVKQIISEWLLTEPKNTERELLIEYTDSLRAYMRESRNNIGFDERESEEFVDIFLTEPNERNEK